VVNGFRFPIVAQYETGWVIRGKWGILNGKGESCVLSCSELRRWLPRLCRLRIVLVGPCGTSIDYALAHMRFMESRKLSSFDHRQIGCYPTLPTRCTPG
jgi:hypothetical protein